ncbi:MAG: hypothetical protein PUF72_07105 [Clostridiales bacterium]|nr:hypothetical protein [Clostridiales bacterium]
MKMKKIVSAAAALAIAATAFAAVTITASAAEEKYDIVFGKAVTDETTGAVTGVDVQTEFTTDSTTLTENKGEIAPYILSGSVLLGNQGGGRIYNLSSEATEGSVVFKAYVSPYAGTVEKYMFNIQAKLTDGTSYNLVQSATNLAKYTGAQNLITINGEPYSCASMYLPRNKVHAYNITIDMNTRKINYNVAYGSSGSRGTLTAYSKLSGSVDIPENVVSITGIEIPRWGVGYDYYFDNVAFYSKVAPDPATKLTKTYKCESKVLGEDVITLADAAKGDNYTYYYPAYIKADDGLYKATSSTYSANVTLNAGETAVDVEYVLDTTNTSYYKEFDGELPYSSAEYFSNGSGGGGTSGEALEVFTITEPGKYKAVIHAGDKQNDNSRSGELRANGENIGTVTYTTGKGTINTIEDLELNAGDVITVTIPRGAYQMVDYVLFVRTGDLIATTEKGYAFNETTTVAELKTKTLTIKATNGEGKTAEASKSLSELGINTTGISDTSNVKFGLIITEIPEDVTITSIVIE